MISIIHFIHLSWRGTKAKTYKIQSTAKMSDTSSGGKPTVSSTSTNVTSPACGIPAAPILAAVDVILIE